MSLNFNISAFSKELETDLITKITQKTKPLGALGQLETLALHIGLCQNSLTPKLSQSCIMIFAADHGIAEAGVSAYPQTVTAQMVMNFLAGGAGINVFAKQHGLKLIIVDAGVNAELVEHPHLINAKMAHGTKNFLIQAAMTEQQCLTAIQKGADLVLKQYETGCNCIGFGEMGIANTSSASVLMHLLTNLPLAQCVGRGTGLNDDQLQHKLQILTQALQRSDIDTLDTFENKALTSLINFGGFEIAMMVGAYLKAAELNMLIMVDGFIASSALCVASKLYPAILDYCIFSHVSEEQGHQALLNYFKARALLNLNLRLGEGSGIALAYPLLQSAVLFLNEMASFAEAGVDNKATEISN